MPGPAGQHTLILQQDWGYEKGNGGGTGGLCEWDVACRVDPSVALKSAGPRLLGRDLRFLPILA